MALRVKEILKEKGLTQVDLADKLGLSTVGLNKMINGNPTLETLSKMAEALDVELRELFESTKEKSIKELIAEIRNNLTQIEKS